ncbi:MAG: phosphoribosylanthranilate isomerase [Chitinophagales bacterium]|nr:phosphoribosylanthranilate isomerase [Chitinophagales bacterium]
MRKHSKLKVCGLKHKNNIYDVVAAGVDYIGLIFYEKSARYMVDSLYPEDIWFLPDEVEKIGVFVDADLEFISKYARLYQLDIIQLHGNESAEFCQQVQSLGYQVIKAFGVNEEFDFSIMKSYIDVVDYFLFDTKSPLHGGTGTSFDWNILEQYPYKTPVFIGGGVSIDNMQQLLNKEFDFLFALDMNSRLEEEPGLKDITLVKKAIEIMKQ